jgi:signal transduction histidine kinase
MSGEATEDDAQQALPVALAAVTVAGQCRERSPVDLALFGQDADRFVPRFAQPAIGEALLARAIEAGAAECVADLTTASGARPFRVSLWRQRGGDRIRLIAAFAAMGEDRPKARQGAAGTVALPAVLEIAHDCHAPLASLIAQSVALRAEAETTGDPALAMLGADMAAGAWRLQRLCDDLFALGAEGGDATLHRTGEIDLTRLARRVMRLAAPVARLHGVDLVLPKTGGEEVPVVLADESSLWGALDDLIRHAIRAAGRGGRVAVDVQPAAGGLALVVRGTPPGRGQPQTPATAGDRPIAHWRDPREREAIATVLAISGAALEEAGAGALALAERVVFPASRCLALP